MIETYSMQRVLWMMAEVLQHPLAIHDVERRSCLTQQTHSLTLMTKSSKYVQFQELCILAEAVVFTHSRISLLSRSPI